MARSTDCEYANRARKDAKMKTLVIATCALALTIPSFGADSNGLVANGRSKLKKYCVVDLSKHRSVEWKDAIVPSVNADNVYKTSKLVLRRIDPGKFEYQPNNYITITKPFYIGVFEVTQGQFELVCGYNPSVRRGARRPVENVCYFDLRGDHLGDQWPKSNKVDEESFIGKIRQLTGLSLDLPTEAQWELACRGGVEAAEVAVPNDVLQQGKFKDNGGGRSHHDEVGSFRPNEFGLYDTFGNVWEVCLDKSAGRGGCYDFGNEKIDTSTDPKGASDGSWIVLRGASWADPKDCARPYTGYHLQPDNRSCANVGLRLCLNLEP